MAVFIPNMQDGTGRFKIAFFQLGDDAVSEVFCSVVARELLALRIVVGVVRYFDDEVISRHSRKSAAGRYRR